jgi:hypothetical protein
MVPAGYASNNQNENTTINKANKCIAQFGDYGLPFTQFSIGFLNPAGTSNSQFTAGTLAETIGAAASAGITLDPKNDKVFLLCNYEGSGNEVAETPVGTIVYYLAGGPNGPLAPSVETLIQTFQVLFPNGNAPASVITAVSSDPTLSATLKTQLLAILEA